MSALTRILNNQIYNQTIIASQKIQPGSITGSLFASNVTVPGDFLITGNLFVLGSSQTTTVASTNTYVNDPLIVLNNGFAGSNTYDEGLIFNRGTSDNKAFIWSETFKEFRLITTAETGTTYGNVTSQLGLANLSINKFYAAGVATVGSFTTLGAANVGSVNSTGNVLASTLIASFVSASTMTVGNIAAVNFGNTGAIYTGASINLSGNVLAAAGVYNALTVNGQTNASTMTVSNLLVGVGGINSNATVYATNFNTGGNVLASTVLSASFVGSAATLGSVNSPFIGNTGTAFTGASINLSGNVLASTVLASYLTASTATVGNISAVTIGNTGATVQGTTAQFTGNVIGGLAQFAAINATPIGNATASTGAFTTLTASSVNSAGNVLATGGVFNALTVNGNETVTGYLNVTGNILASTGTINTLLVNDATNATSATAGGALTIAGGAAVAKDLWVGGNLYAANIIGVTANVITVQDPLLYLRPGNTYPYNYDIGVYSAFEGVSLATANVYQHTGIVRDWHNSTWTFASNLTEPGGGSVLFDANTVYDPIKAGNLSLVNTTVSTSTGTGALIVSGGAGIAGTVVAGQLNSTGNVLGQGAVFNSLQINGAVGVTGNVIGGLAQFAAINATPIGNATASTGAFTTLSASAGIWGNSTTASTNTTTGALVLAGGLGLAGNIFQGGAYHDTSATNALLFNTPTTVDAFKAATDLEVGATTGTMTINNPTVVGSQATQALFNTVASTVNFARAANITMGHTSGITTLQGAANIQATTASTNAGTGALKVQGGVAVNGNLNISGGNRFYLGLDQVANAPYAEDVVGIIANANAAARLTIKNVNNESESHSEIFLINNIGSNVEHHVGIGIKSSDFNWQMTGYKIYPNDAYIYTAGGNLVLSSEKDVVLSATGATDSDVRLSATHANISIGYTSPASSATTGALNVVGGVGFQSNLYVAKGAVFNSTNGIEGFTVKSSTSGNVAIFANVKGLGGSTTESVIIGGGNLTVQPGAILKVSGVTSMMVPVGPTGARPSSQGANDVAGMLRFNSTINQMEFYDGTQWQVAGSVFTVISDRQFSGNVAGGYGNVDGTNTTFTIQANATTSGCIVSINGVMQFPTLAYSVSGTTLTFTEPPAPDDVIDVRVLTTTTTVSSITNGNGINQYIAADTGVQMWTGTSDGGTVKRIEVDTAGDMNLLAGTDITYTQTAVNIAANNTPYVIATRSQTTFTSGKLIVTAKRGTGATGNVETYEAQVITDGAGNAYISTYGVTNNGYAMGVLSANVLAGNVQVYYTGVIASSVVQANVKCFGTYIL